MLVVPAWPLILSGSTDDSGTTTQTMEWDDSDEMFWDDGTELDWDS